MKNTNYSLHPRHINRHKLIQSIVTYIFLGILAVIMLYPLVLLVNVSLKTTNEFLNNPVGIVTNVTFSNYVTVWRSMEVFKRLFTTVWMTAVTCVISLSICFLCAFPLSRGYFKGAMKVYLFIIISMYFPGSLVANIVILKDILHVYGSPPALIILWVMGGMQMNIFMLTGFSKSVPKELDEAAFVDGCGYFRFIFTIALPLMKPIMFTLLLMKIIGCWNDFLGPFIYITDPEFRTLSTGLFQFKSAYGATWNYFTAAIFIVAFPIIILYIFFQKFIINGMIMGAIKG